MTAPDEYARRVAEVFGPAGAGWLDRLPALLDDLARRWSLTLQPPLGDLSYGYVAPAVRADGADAILKLAVPNPELRTEAAALRLYAGRGAVRLLDADPDRGALLLERIRPGTPLLPIAPAAPVPQAEDESATIAAARLMLRLWRPAPPGHPFPTLDDWVRRMAERAPRLIGPGSRFPAGWIDRALALFDRLADSAEAPVLLHGDLHHGNILRAEREPWLAIDPKGVVGEPIWETGPLLLNALPPSADAEETRRILARRVSWLASELGRDRERLRAAAVVRAVLAGFWSLEDHGSGWERELALAGLLEAL